MKRPLYTKNKKKYIILGYNPDTNTYAGYCEDSWSMCIDTNRVQVYTDYEFNSYNPNNTCNKFNKNQAKQELAQHSCRRINFYDEKIVWARTTPNSKNQFLWFWLRSRVLNLNKVKLGGYTWKLYRLNSKNCPVTVDYSEIYDMINNKIPYRKYIARNKPFKVKE